MIGLGSLAKIGVIAAWCVLLPSTLLAQRGDEALRLDNAAKALQDAGRLQEALQLSERALEIRESQYGPDHIRIAGFLNNLALIYDDLGRYADAERLHKRTLEIRERAHGPMHRDVIATFGNLANTYMNQGRYAEAEALFIRALEGRERTLRGNHPDVALALNNLAALYLDQGRFAEAEPLFQRALEIRSRAHRRAHPEVAQALNNLGALYFKQGRYGEAETYYKQALQMRERVLGREHPDVGQSLSNLGMLYNQVNRYEEAEPLYLRALAVRERILGPDHPQIANTALTLANHYIAQRRYADAEVYIRRALAIRERVFGPDHPEVARVVGSYGVLNEEMGRSADAERLYKRALAILEKAHGSDHSDVAFELNNLAKLYASHKRFDEAERLYKRAISVREKALNPNHMETLGTVNNLAVMYKDQGRFAEALPLIRRVNDAAGGTKLSYPVLVGAQDKRLLSRAEVLEESFRVLQRSLGSAAGHAVSQLAARFGAGTGQLAELVRKDQDLIAESATLDRSLLAAVSKSSSERNSAEEAKIRRRIAAIEAEREAISKQLNQRFPDYAELSQPQALSLKEIQQLLDDDEALLAIDFDVSTFGWIVTRTDADWTQLKISGEEIEAQVKRLRSSLSFKVNQPFDTALAHSLYRTLLGPFEAKFASKKRLSMVMNGALTSLPPAVLVTKDPANKAMKDVAWLARSHAITILPSVGSLKVLRGASPTSSAQKPMVAFADPVFGKAEAAELRALPNFLRGGQVDLAALARSLPALPDTADEVRAIAAVLKVEVGDLKLGAAASEASVKQSRLDDYRIVYFATHGLVAGDVQLFSSGNAEPALALTIPQRPTALDDGLLTASEVAQLKLNADWVVLSACNTAAEQKPGAEALSGLARAFFYAGARSLMVSHWEVNSQATVGLMVGVFLGASRDPKLTHAQALQRSMLAMIDSATSDAEAHPRFWAPFVVVGEPKRQ